MSSHLPTGPVQGSVSPSVRQWFYFPPCSGASKTSRLRHFHLLVESSVGPICFVAIKSRNAPDQSTAELMADLFNGSNPYGDMQQFNAYLNNLGLQVELLDGQIDSEVQWLSSAVLGEAVLDETMIMLARGNSTGEASRSQIEARLRQQWKAGMATFIENLDCCVVDAARNIGSDALTPSIYNYLNGSGDLDQLKKRNRVQAVSVFPFLVSALPVQRELAPIRDAIDLGKPPLIDYLSQFFLVPKSAIRSLRHQSPSCIGAQWAACPGRLARVIADIPPHVRPTTPEMWAAFNATVILISKILRRPVDMTSNRLWLREAALQGYRVADEMDFGLERAAHDISEFSARLTEALCYQLRTTTGVIELSLVATTVRRMMMEFNPIRLARIASRWREAYVREQAAFSAERQLWLGARWQTILGEPFESDSHKLVCLATASELATEGTVMANCVASYAGDCLDGKCQIWSVRDAAGKSLSTLETYVDEGTLAVSIRQHRGFRNSKPPTECNLAVSHLLRHLQRCRSEVTSYIRWKKNIAELPKDERMLAAMYMPVLAALEEALPKQWPLQKMLTIARRAHADRKIRIHCDNARAAIAKQALADSNGMAEPCVITLGSTGIQPED